MAPVERKCDEFDLACRREKLMAVMLEKSVVSGKFVDPIDGEVLQWDRTERDWVPKAKVSWPVRLRKFFSRLSNPKTDTKVEEKVDIVTSTPTVVKEEKKVNLETKIFIPVESQSPTAGSQIHKRFPNAVIRNSHSGDLTAFRDGKMYLVRDGVAIKRQNQICDNGKWEDIPTDEQQFYPEWNDPVEIVSYPRSGGDYFYFNSASGLKMIFNGIWLEDGAEYGWPLSESEIHKRFPNALIKRVDGSYTAFHDGKMYRIRNGIVVWRKNQICDDADWENVIDEKQQLRAEWKNPAEIVSFRLSSPYYLNTTTGLRVTFDKEMQIWLEDKPMAQSVEN